MIKAEDFKWLDWVYHLFHLGSYLCLSGALTDCFLPLTNDVSPSGMFTMILLVPFLCNRCMKDHLLCVSDSSQFDCRGKSCVLWFVMVNALSFSLPLRYKVSPHSVLHQHFIYHMFIHVVSVVCYNSLCFLPSLRFFILLV